MKTKHTPEPWRVDFEVIRSADGKNPIVSQVGALRAGGSQDLKRIVACVNACAGIVDPAAAIATARSALELAFDSMPEPRQSDDNAAWDQWDAARIALRDGIKALT